MYLDYDVSCKVTAIYSDAEKSVIMLSFVYDDGGNRIMKKDHRTNSVTWYSYDVAGTLLAVFESKNGGALQLLEQPVYGSGRLGMLNRLGGVGGFDANLGSIIISKYSFVDNSFSGIAQGDLEYSFNFSTDYQGVIFHIEFGNLKHNGVEMERKLSGSVGALLLTQEFNYDALNKKFASDTKLTGSLGTFVVGEANLILKIVPLKK